MNTPKFTPQEQAQIEAGLTVAQAVARIEHLRPVAMAAMDETGGMPVTPEALEFCQLNRALYLGHFHGKASASKAGGHYGL